MKRPLYGICDVYREGGCMRFLDHMMWFCHSIPSSRFRVVFLWTPHLWTLVQWVVICHVLEYALQNDLFIVQLLGPRIVYGNNIDSYYKALVKVHDNKYALIFSDMLTFCLLNNFLYHLTHHIHKIQRDNKQYYPNGHYQERERGRQTWAIQRLESGVLSDNWICSKAKDQSLGFDLSLVLSNSTTNNSLAQG